MDPATHAEWMRKFRVLFIAVAILFSLLLLRLFHLQVTTFADYAKESEDNRINQKRVKAPRGRILDRHGRVLARNRASYTVSLISSSRQRNAETIVALENALGEEIPLPASPERFKRLKRDVDFETVCIVEERLMDDWPLAIAIEPQRQYPLGPVASHLIGYMGQLPRNETGKLPSGRYVMGDYVGRSGVERVFEDTLRGWDGVRYVEVDAKSRIVDEFPFPDRERAPTSGEDLVSDPGCRPSTRCRSSVAGHAGRQCRGSRPPQRGGAGDGEPAGLRSQRLRVVQVPEGPGAPGFERQRSPESLASRAVPSRFDAQNGSPRSPLSKRV